MPATQETYTFQAEVRQLLDLMIHSVYSNKDVFLRELISNASDALDKRRFAAVENPALLAADTVAQIELAVDKDARTLTISDTGIGMSREELIDLIGTIAKSGTKEFMRRLRESKQQALDAQMIGQFGVGFYSVFMVADRVVLLTRRAGGDTAVRWESSGDGTYTIEETTKDEPGTAITLHLKQDAEGEGDGFDSYLDPWTLKRIVRQYSDFVAYPIVMDVPQRGEEGKETVERETLNSMKAIWLRDKSSVTEEEYAEFYKHVAHDWQEPLLRIQARIEGTLEYSMLLFVPSKAPFDLYWHPNQRRDGVHLYVRRVLIMDDCKDLLPDYLRFLRGVVDSEDLSLNLSRETLHQDRQLRRIGKGVVNKALNALQDLAAKEAEKYETFWQQFGRVLKEGLIQDHEQKDPLLALLRCASTNDPQRDTSLAEYIARMKPEQEAIYYIVAESRARAEASPHIEAFKAKGYEVLLLADPVDEVWTQSVQEYKGKKLQSVGKGTIDLGTAEEREQAESERKDKQEAHGPLLGCLQKRLDATVKEVRLSNRLTESPACLVGGEGDMTPQLEQMLRAMGQEAPAAKRILEINPSHPLLAKLQALYDADPESATLQDYAELLHGQALLAEGAQPADPARLGKLITKLMVGSH